MKLLVLGATGGTGIEVVSQAMERGHSVTAFVRSPERLKKFADRVAVVQGDLLREGEMARAMQGQDAILSAFGPRNPVSKNEADLLQRFAVVLTGAMENAGVRRVVIESTAFLFKDAIFPPANLIGRLFFSGVVADATAMERIIAGSRLDWTLVRPPQLTDKPRVGSYRVREGHLPLFGFAISRADVADFMIKSAEEGAFIRKVAGGLQLTRVAAIGCSPQVFAGWTSIGSSALWRSLASTSEQLIRATGVPIEVALRTKERYAVPLWSFASECGHQDC